jgi:hypothetical protein
MTCDSQPDLDEKRLEGDVIAKNVAVSKLSRLQKRILVYAYKAMLAKGQKIETSPDATICLPAPEWLAKALTEALREVFERGRRVYQLEELDLLGWHPWLRFFAEVEFIEEKIKDAAGKANFAMLETPQLTKLYELAKPRGMLIGIRKLAYDPLPHHDGTRWFFCVTAKGMTPAEAMESMEGTVGKEQVDAAGIWVDDNKIVPMNCTIPELLRDLFEFPIQEGGHIDALAFSPDEIGRGRYNAAQAALRRACSRLEARRLIGFRTPSGGGADALYRRMYARTGICLQEAGIAIAAELLRAENQAASADLGLFHPRKRAPAHLSGGVV